MKVLLKILLCIGISATCTAAWFGMGILLWVSFLKNIILTILIGIVGTSIFVTIHELVFKKDRLISKLLLDFCVFPVPLIACAIGFIYVCNSSKFDFWEGLGYLVMFMGMGIYIIAIGVLSFITIMILKAKQKAK